MKCPKCQTENEQSRRFCRECGTKFSIICPDCNFENNPGDRFCGGCGYNLTIPTAPPPKDLSFDDKLDKIQRYLPKGLTEKILAQRGKIEGERRQVTVMFCDMEGFTPLVEKLGPEEAYSIMDQVYEILIHKVHDYEGTVNEMTGDGVMALFGAPVALEDAPQRAIRSAMAIHLEMTQFCDRIKQEGTGIPTIKMRIGIHTGPVVVGTVGNNLRVEFKAVGDTVNLASRMEGMAMPGTTYVTRDTFNLTEGFFRFEALGEREVKGKQAPVKVFRVIAPSTRRTRFDVSAERGLTPFLGRNRELELLLDGFERAKDGRGQAFSIMAEAGVGKSRLLYEFRKAVTNEDVTFLEGRCLSYSKNMAYHPVIDILKSNFDVRESDGDIEIREKVKAGLKVMKTDEGSTLPYLLDLLSVKDSGIDKIPMSPGGKKDRIIDALKQIILKGSAIRPLIIAFEDLHWVDKSSEDVLKDLLDNIPGEKVLLLFTYRPGFLHSWGVKSFHNQITLNRLSKRESLLIVNHLLGTEDIDRVLEELFIEKTEGVPLFAEEFVRLFKELNAIERKGNKCYLAKDAQDMTIPSTIQDVIMARIDSLPEEAKRIIQTASVIEREFSYELISRVTSIPEQELLSHLSILKDSELIYERGIYPQSTYVFKHALTREVVYDSILTKRRKILHEKIGNSIEDLYKENIDEYSGILAEHFIESENYEKGADYSKLASKKAQKAASFNDAITYGKKRVACLEKLPETEDIEKKIIDARVTVGLYYNQMCYHIKAKEVVEPIVKLALKHDYKRRLSQIYTIIGTYTYAQGDYPEGIRYLQDALKIAEDSNDFVSLWAASHWIGHALAENCDFERALYHLKNSLKINEAVNILWGISIMKSCIAMTVYNWQGKIDLAYQTSSEGLRLAEKSGDALSKAEAHTSYGACLYFKGFFDEAERHLLKGSVFSEKIDYVPMIGLASLFLGDTYYETRKYVKYRQYYNKGKLAFEHLGGYSSYNIMLIKVGITRAEVMNNEKDIDLRLLYGYEAENKIKLFEGSMARYISEILLNIDDQYLSEAEDWINKAVEADKRNGMMWHLARDYAFASELYRRKGNESKAKKNLSNAIEIFKECGADGWVEKYEKELATLS